MLCYHGLSIVARLWHQQSLTAQTCYCKTLIGFDIEDPSVDQDQCEGGPSHGHNPSCEDLEWKRPLIEELLYNNSVAHRGTNK